MNHSQQLQEAAFLKFHSGYYGEVVDNIKQITHCAFTGEELLDYLQAYALSLSEPEKPYGYVFEGKFYTKETIPPGWTFSENSKPIPVYLKGVLHSPDTGSKKK